eukprot:scaffold918_cov126-Cylindrotheca_fusiformis.AAC.64
MSPLASAFMVKPQLLVTKEVAHRGPSRSIGIRSRGTTEIRSTATPPPIENPKNKKNKRRGFFPRIIRDDASDGTPRSRPLRRRSIPPSTTETPEKTATTLVQQIHTLQDYKKQVVDQQESSLVVVFFTAPWCRTCQRLQPRIRKLAASQSGVEGGVKLVQVPLLTERTAKMVQGLGVHKFPMVHIYHSTAGLVEERSIYVKTFGEFETLLESYQKGFCPVEYNEDSTSNHHQQSQKLEL